MFKKLFSRENAVPVVSVQKRVEEVAGDENGSNNEVNSTFDAGKAFWANLNMKKGKNKQFRRLRDVYNQLPLHLANRIRQIDYVMGSVAAETHKMLTLIFNEVYRQNKENPYYLDESIEFEEWYERFEKMSMDFKKQAKKSVNEFLGKLSYTEKDVERLNDIVESKPSSLEQLLGLENIEDLKSNLIDVAVLMGKETEGRITQNIIDEPVRVTMRIINRIS